MNTTTTTTATAGVGGTGKAAKQDRFDYFIGREPPRDGRSWEPMCARCGSSVEFERCEVCVDGLDGHDCGEDSCCCLHPEPNVPCDVCQGRGGWERCCSGPAWCQNNPRPGREKTERGEIEWYAEKRVPAV